mmetsp:Transcript_9110/g.27458  ORF Transcript_9110/g.27458 Transcript_9110/m.27458 type:complete len:200 (+) Transcript_9110:954-1553(+)
MSAAARLGCAEKDAASVCGARAIVPLEPRADVVDPGSRGREVHAETVARDARGRGRADGIGDEFHDYEHVFYPLARRAASHDVEAARRRRVAPRRRVRRGELETARDSREERATSAETRVVLVRPGHDASRRVQGLERREVFARRFDDGEGAGALDRRDDGARDQKATDHLAPRPAPSPRRARADPARADPRRPAPTRT